MMFPPPPVSHWGDASLFSLSGVVQWLSPAMVDKVATLLRLILLVDWLSERGVPVPKVECIVVSRDRSTVQLKDSDIP